MAYNGQQNGDIRATLALSQEEASNGTTRTLNLPGGRQVVIPIPAGSYDGQEIRLPGQGEFIGAGTRGSLILTIAIAPAEYFGSQNFPQPGTDFPTIFSETPPPPPRVSSPHYPPVNSAGNYTNYAQYPSQTQARGSINRAWLLPHTIHLHNMYLSIHHPRRNGGGCHGS